MRTFRDLLRAQLKLAESADREGDAEHLRRWLIATPTLARLPKDQEIQAGFANFILSVLAVRRTAEKCDRLNSEIVNLKKRDVKKAHRQAMVQFADGVISQMELDAHLADRKERESLRSKVPLLIVRSDKGGSRKRTIFCRLLSRLYRRTTGRWHDAEVAALCNIAFDCDGTATIETVKDARKSVRLGRLAKVI